MCEFAHPAKPSKNARTNFVLPLHALFILRAVLLLHGLVALDRLDELGLDERRLRLLDLPVAARATLCLECLHAPLERRTERARVLHELVQLRCIPLCRHVVHVVQRARVQVPDRPHVLVEQPDALLY